MESHWPLVWRVRMVLNPVPVVAVEEVEDRLHLKSRRAVAARVAMVCLGVLSSPQVVVVVHLNATSARSRTATSGLTRSAAKYITQLSDVLLEDFRQPPREGTLLFFGGLDLDDCRCRVELNLLAVSQDVVEDLLNTRTGH